MQLSLFKDGKNLSNNSKYFIPCYDIINNEIYFTEFFTEEIISNIEETAEDNNFFAKQKDENINKRTKEISTIKLSEDDKKILLQKNKINYF